FLKNKKSFLELDLLVELVKNGNKKFAYVPDAGLFHHHAKTLVDLLKKRSRNVTRVYLKNNEARKYRWFNLESVQGILKVLFWVLWANLFLPSLLSGLYKTFRFKTLVAFYEPVVNILVTDIILIAFLADFRGRKLLRWG
ncbi:hypothetical protein CL622_04925, partial [archaeon]|nr:hypothetical protein [archaeon]